MHNLTDVFQTVANAFTSGDVRSAAGPLSVPTAIYVGQKIILVNHVTTVEKSLRVYRNNLSERGYKRTDMQITHLEITGQGAVKSSLEWTNVDQDEGVINKVFGNYFCKQDDQGHWTIDMIEFAEPSHPELLEGVALH